MADGAHDEHQSSKKRRSAALERLRTGPKTCELSHLDYAAKCMRKCGWEVDVEDDGQHFRAYTFRVLVDGLAYSKIATVCTNPKGDHLLPIYVKKFLKEVDNLLDIENGAGDDE